MTHQTKVILLAALLAGVHVQGSAQTTTAPKSAPHQVRTVSNHPAASPLSGVIHALLAAHRFEQAAISPDGTGVAWVEVLVGSDGAPNGHSAIHVAAVNAVPAPRRITAAASGVACAEGNVAWSPDSRRIAFLSDAAKPGQLQLYVTHAAGGPARRLTGVKGFLATPGWSPDGRTIALVSRCGGIKLVTPMGRDVTPGRGPCRVIGATGVPIWSPDGNQIAVARVGWTSMYARAGIFVMDTDGRNLRLLTHETARGVNGRSDASWQPRRSAGSG